MASDAKFDRPYGIRNRIPSPLIGVIMIDGSSRDVLRMFNYVVTSESCVVYTKPLEGLGWETNNVRRYQYDKVPGI